jgi:hypothetical protein
LDGVAEPVPRVVWREASSAISFRIDCFLLGCLWGFGFVGY